MPTPFFDRRLELLLLGSFEVRLNGAPVTGFSYNKMRALLAYLAVERKQDHSRETLAALLWDGNDSETARGNLRRTLADLRRVLELPSGKILFSTSKHSIRFDSDAYVDVLDFAGQENCADVRHEEKIFALYRGEFLNGLSMPDCPDFEEWLQEQREAMHRHALALAEKLADHHEQAGDYSKALQFALRHIELEPWDERAHRSAMRLYALNGQHSAAMHQYENCRRLLEKELGALPDKETRQLAERIRDGELRRAPSFAAIATTQDIPQILAGRRQVTVLYCELHAEIDDPDEAMELLQAPQARCMEIIRQFYGHIVQTHGGGLLAYFGYPQADEYAARHAVQAALAVTLETVHGVEIRAGVHTGLIITGGDTSIPDVVGKTSRTAIQLRLGVTHNEVAISPETHTLVAGYFDCLSLGEQSLSGMERPVEIFRVVRESGARTRLDAAAQLTPFIGRTAEISKLLGWWEKAAQGARQVVLVQGEAGIGKSRLLLTLKQRLADQPHVIREARCFPEFSQSPFHPLIAMFEGILGFAAADAPEVKSGKLAQYIETNYPAAAQETVPLLALLLALPLPGQYLTPVLSPQKQKEQTLAVLLNLMHALSAQQPVLLIVEDMHWIDPSSLELLTLFIGQKKESPVLVVLTARPEFVSPWKKAVDATLMLSPLAADEAAKMIVAIREHIPPAILHGIVRRADGVPLFVEEMAKIAALDNRASIPISLHDLLAARIDQMGEAKYTAQLAATIGREFDLALLRKVSPYSHAQFAHTLDALQEAGLILQENESARQFKHALIQEAAYQSQTKTGRQTAHRRIAQILQSDFADVASSRPELLAQHFAAANETRLAIEYWVKAGQRATRNSANMEAIKHFNSGLQLVMALPPDAERDRLEAELRANLGAVLITAQGYGSAEADQAYSRALELEEQLGDSSGFFKALWGMWFTSSSRVSHALSLELAEKLLRLAEQNNDPLQLQLAHYAVGNSSFMTGDQNAARAHLEQAVALYQPSQHDAMVSQFGENTCVSSLSILSLVLWLQGYPAQAGTASQQALSLARQLNHPHSLGYALCIAAILNRWMKQLETTRLSAQEAMALAQEHGLPLWLGLGASAHGWVLAMQGQAAGVAQIQKCLDAVNDIMSGARVFFLAPLSEALVHLGQFDHALSKIKEAIVILNAKDSRFFESELYRLKGICLLEISASNSKKAEACFNRALAISRKQHAKSLELRAATSMARLWQRQNRPEDARRLLQEIYDGFTEDFANPDLQEAAALLRALAEPPT